MSEKSVKYLALCEVVSKDELEDWVETTNGIKAIVVAKIKQKAVAGKVSKSHIAAALTTFSEFTASLIKLMADDNNNRELFKEAFIQGLDYWLEKER